MTQRVRQERIGKSLAGDEVLQSRGGSGQLMMQFLVAYGLLSRFR